MHNIIRLEKGIRKTLKIRIIEITKKPEYESYLYKCISPIPFRKYKRRDEYLKYAIPRGFKKKILIYNDKVVGQIEYTPTNASGYPIFGEDIVVMNCIWVLRKVKGQNFGRKLMEEMIKDYREMQGFATIALENYWSPWFKKWQMEKLGFKSIDSIEVKNKIKHINKCFKIHLMWLSKNGKAKTPRWNKLRMLEGVKFCIAHPLYNSDRWRIERILEEC